MCIVYSESLPVEDDPIDNTEGEPGRESGRGGEREIQWKVVAKTAGITNATIIADRLLTEGIPARAWQEGAGQALGLTVGLLGTGYVVVPEENVQEAEKILSEPWDPSGIEDFTAEIDELSDESEDFTTETDEFSAENDGISARFDESAPEENGQ